MIPADMRMQQHKMHSALTHIVGSRLYMINRVKEIILCKRHAADSVVLLWADLTTCRWQTWHLLLLWDIKFTAFSLHQVWDFAGMMQRVQRLMTRQKVNIG